ncbi:hypothetical protein [Marimonas arenosa]|uniref:DUF998 domain-containing protein n=1 Tax=Marimonas arenosa TaxID=1795305 RepID=A0AAE3WBY8_9RHOB|nr:hypothetical protein [Marimonas arenosa]MDQ2088885.1 hypothetical protein [Marimonas arenosa]
MSDDQATEYSAGHYLAAREEIVDNFYRVRRALGYLGFSMPFLLLAVGFVFGKAEPSISDYYHTILRDIFVGTLTAIGVFLICYTGFRRDERERFSDDLVTTVAGISALVAAFVPNRGTLNTSMEPQALAQHVFGVWLCDITHHVAALCFLLSMAYLCRFKFARTAKPARRRIYIACFWIIIAGTVATIISASFRKIGTPAQKTFVIDYQLVFWFETLGVWAFSLSWLVKGRADRAIIGRAREISRRPL